MAVVKIRYYRISRDGKRSYWEPTPAMKRQGFRSVPLGRPGAEAEARANELNRKWDQVRSRGRALTGTENRAASEWVYPTYSIGEAFQRYRRTAEWAKKPLRTREDWERGWKYIGPVFGKHRFDDVTLETVGIWRDGIEADVSLQEAHRALKIWRALWKVAAGMRYCRRDEDPSLAIINRAPKGRKEVWKEGEIVRIVKAALRNGFHGIALGVAILYDGSASPGDVRSLTASQMRTDGLETWFDYARGKTGRDGVQTLSQRTQRLLAWYLMEQFGDSELLPTMTILRTRRGVAYTKNSFAEDFRDIRNMVLPGDKRQMRDLRRTGAVEAVAGGAKGFQLSAKLANNIGQSGKLEATYAPVQVQTARQVDAARRDGRRVLMGNKNG